MANLIQKALQRSQSSITLDEYIQFFNFQNLSYPYSLQQTMNGDVIEKADGSYESFVYTGFKNNGVVFACMAVRQLTFSEARFTWRRRTNGRPGDYFGTKDLAILEKPWPGGNTASLLSRAIQDVDLAGNFFATRRPGNRIKRMRPDWVTIILGSYEDPATDPYALDADIVGYMYHPGGRYSGAAPVLLLPEFVAHWAPIPDPLAQYRGMSWLTPVIREYMSDTAMITHKSKFFENGATPNMVVTLDPGLKKESFKEWVSMFSERYSGALNAYKTLYLGAGATVTPVGKDFRQMDFAVTQAAGETRIAAASGVPPVIVGLSEGLKNATYSNYQQARRRYADMTMRPLWRSMATSLDIIVPSPDNAELWYDDRDIPFLAEDIKDRAEVQTQQSTSIGRLIDVGFDPDIAVLAITSGDLSLLKGSHSGLYSVQLQPPGTKQPDKQTDTPATGNLPALPSGKEKALPSGKVPTPSGNGKASREATDMLLEVARKQTIEVHAHFPEGMIKIEAPKSTTRRVERDPVTHEVVAITDAVE